MSSAAISTHSGAGPLSLMSCVRESSPLQDFDSDTEKNVATKKKFWTRIKWFKRKNKVIEDSVLPVSDYMQTNESLRSRSTSELSIEEPPRKRNGGSSMYPGLSVSHDSVFHSPHSGSETDLEGARSSSSLCLPSQPQAELQTELSERLRLRRSGVGRGDTSEDDEGLPRSPCNSPTTTDTLDKTAIKDLPNKSHSTCSDGSLLSVGSSDIEEDLLSCQLRHPSKSSLSEYKNDWDLNTSSIPLNHSAAHHRVSVKPKKTHGVPRRKKGQQLPNTLPTTIEVNEESSIRSISPETRVPPGGLDAKLNRSRSNAGSKSQDGLEDHAEKEETRGGGGDKSFFERLFPRRSAKKKKAKSGNDDKKQEEKKMKLEEHHQEKKKTAEYEKYNIREVNNAIVSSSFSMTYSKQQQNSESSYRRYESRPIPAVRSGAAYRQRFLPIDIPDSPDATRKEEEIVGTKNQLPDILSTSPLQQELENKLKQRLTRSSPQHQQQSFEVPDLTSADPEERHKERVPKTPPVSSRYFENNGNKRTTTTVDDGRAKMKLAGLSSLQQKALALNEDEGDYHNFKSLTEFPSGSSPQKSTTVLLTKSFSFKGAKSQIVGDVSTSTPVKNEKDDDIGKEKTAMGKSSSLDSVKLIETSDKQQDNRIGVKTFTEKIEHERIIKQRTIEIKCDITLNNNEADSLDEQITRCMMETKSLLGENDVYPDKSNITISGPSHTAVVNVKNSRESFKNKMVEETKVSQTNKEQLISITKINVQPEQNDVNKILTSPESPIILETKPLIVAKSPKRTPEQQTTKTAGADANVDREPTVNHGAHRKFSRDDVEIVDKEEIKVVQATVGDPRLYKKNEKNASKKSVTTAPDSPEEVRDVPKSTSTSLKSSGSLDSLVSDHRTDNSTDDKSSQDSLDDVTSDKKQQTQQRRSSSTSVREKVVLRKKSSSVKETTKDEEPELMKVFARRSLKLKDSENETLNQQLSVMLNENNYCDNNKTRDSDNRENQADSPVVVNKERKQSTFIDNKKENAKIETNNNINNNNKIKKTNTDASQLRKKSTSSDEENQKDLDDKKRRTSLNEKNNVVEKKEQTTPVVIHSKPIPITTIRRENSTENNDAIVTLRKPSEQFVDSNKRALSVSNVKQLSVDSSQNILRKQFLSRRRTDNWITNIRQDEGEKDKEDCGLKDEEISPKEVEEEEEAGSNEDEQQQQQHLIIEPKNFNQRKAEWEKRAQEAQKKSTP